MKKERLTTKKFFYSSFLIFILAIIGLPANISNFNEAMEVYKGKGKIITGIIRDYQSETASNGAINQYYIVDFNLSGNEQRDKFYRSLGYTKPKSIGDQIELVELSGGEVIINSIGHILLMPSFYLLFNICLLMYGFLWIYLYLHFRYFPLKDYIENISK